MQAMANALAGRYRMAISSEEPEYLFDGDKEDVRVADPEWSAEHPTAHYLVPKRWHLAVTFATLPGGSPANPEELLQDIVETANAGLPYAYRLQRDGEFYAFVPTRGCDAQGVDIETVPLLDRRVSIPARTRSLAESGRVMAEAL